MDIVFTKVSMYGNIINNYNDTLVNWIETLNDQTEMWITQFYYMG